MANYLIPHWFKVLAPIYFLSGFLDLATFSMSNLQGHNEATVLRSLTAPEGIAPLLERVPLLPARSES